MSGRLDTVQSKRDPLFEMHMLLLRWGEEALAIGKNAGGAPGVEIEADSQTEQPERHKEMSNAVRAEGV
jgi:hypothetical protein